MERRIAEYRELRGAAAAGGLTHAKANDRRHRDRGAGGHHDPAGLRACRASRSRISATTSGWRSPATAGCASSRWRNRRSRSPLARCRRPTGMVIQTNIAEGDQGAKGRDGVPADQPSARLPDLRPGRRVRSAGPGDGLRLRPRPVRREQARGAGQGFRPAGQDQHESLHPLHALHPLPDRDRRGRGTRRHRARRGHGDRHLYRAGAQFGAVGQHHRSVPGRRADLEALCLRRPALGAAEDRIGRCARRGRQQHPDRHPRVASVARPAAPQRGGERGVDLRQDPLRHRRAEPPAARPPLYPPRRQLQEADWREALDSSQIG